MSTYLYGVIRRPGPRSKLTREALGTGVGEPPARVRMLEYRDIAAIVSTVDGPIGYDASARALRRDMVAHSAVQSRIFNIRTILPARFGLMMPDDRTAREALLAPQYDQLLEDLQRLKGKVELSVKADYVEQGVIRQVLQDDPPLAQAIAGRSGRENYNDRIDLGRQIAQAIRARRDHDAQWLLDQIAPLASDLVTHQAQSELSVLRASVLVATSELPAFDRELARIQEEAGPGLRLGCVGPLPAYSFVSIHVPVEEDAQWAS